MVNGYRRSRSGYPLNERHHGTTYRERRLSVKCVKFVTTFSPLLLIAPAWARPLIANTLILSIQQYRYINRWLIIPRTIFINRHRTAATFTDAKLYDMRITDRAHIPLLMVALLPGLQRWECENGVVESLEVGFMMFLYWVSFPRKISVMQEIFGREYSQISRIMKAVWNFLDTTWSRLVTDNLDYFVGRLPEYNRCFRAKYFRLHGRAR
jgi:hypothetical protein